MNFPQITEDIPWITTEQMIEVDRAMMEDYRIELMQMMENAGRCLAILARDRFLGGDPRGHRVVVLAGTGGNGGGALVCARRLHNWGAHVTVCTTKTRARFTPIPAHQFGILQQMGRAPKVFDPSAPPAEENLSLILDGVIGYSLQGTPRGNAGTMIQWANAQSAPTLSLDAPSGVDTTSGTVYDPATVAAATMTLALPKEGLRAPKVQAQVGELYLADISVPPELYAIESLKLHVGPIFATSDVVRLR